jgi:peptidoglycan-N-acetylglucosamine deacetylase
MKDFRIAAVAAFAMAVAPIAAACATHTLPAAQMPHVSSASRTSAAAAAVSIDDALPRLGVGPLGEVWRVPMMRKEIALTFDDGPYPFYTPLLLHELERSHVVATFFLVGRSAQEFPELVQDIIGDGDEIGNHTFNHYKLTNLSAADVERQIALDGQLLSTFAGHPITLFRPPHGRFDHRVVELAHEMGYDTVFWNDSPEDTKDISPALVVSRVLEQATPGGIVLLHNGQYKTIEALPVIIDRLRDDGYTFVTVSQLLADGGT